MADPIDIATRILTVAATAAIGYHTLVTHPKQNLEYDILAAPVTVNDVGAGVAICNEPVLQPENRLCFYDNNGDGYVDEFRIGEAEAKPYLPYSSDEIEQVISDEKLRYIGRKFEEWLATR